ncbi:MAG TPA: vanadium-dependent haloperoxidase [Candidatus Sumerlaeota bacterium]|nr:vanadium-dependent haloperoxidase [Candidatus Sumerlaeota bacterium]
MYSRPLIRSVLVLFSVLLVTTSSRLPADPVLDWNQIACEAIRADPHHAAPTYSTRDFAMVHVAILDAFVAIRPFCRPYAAHVDAEPGASVDAAMAQAAWTVLVALFPAQAAELNAALADALAAIPAGPARDAGVTVGNAVAQQILDLRSQDGAENLVDYEPGTDPGHWRPTFPNFAPALGPHWGNVTPFVLESAPEFRPPPPPPLDSPQYAADFELLKSIGVESASSRTDEQTEIGIFWAYDRFGMGPPTILYNRFLVDLVLELGNTVEQNARLFALANLAMADAGIVTWEAKYYYNFWRPITAIREGANDGNSATDGDPDWVPLGAPGGDGPSFTPPFPSYPSGHAAFGAALYQALANFYVTDAMSFSATSEEMPGVIRNYDSFRAAADENGISRIYLGVHWTFDNTEAANLGRNVADYVFAHAGLEENAVDRSWTHYH